MKVEKGNGNTCLTRVDARLLTQGGPGLGVGGPWTVPRREREVTEESLPPRLLCSEVAGRDVPLPEESTELSP